MPKQLFVRHTYWTLWYQDGQAGDERFETEFAAKQAARSVKAMIKQEFEDKLLEDYL
jgi:D-hexose-6-phosphate mutarotase